MPTSSSSVQFLTAAREATPATLFEDAARSAKLDRLVATTDATTRARGLDPHRDAARVYESVTGVDFAEIVRRSGVKTPSSTTTEAFLGILRGRITRAA
jgi:hypothetical protein